MLLAGVSNVTTTEATRLVSTAGIHGLPQNASQSLSTSTATDAPAPPASAATAPCQLKRVQKRPSMVQINIPDIIIEIILVM